MAPAPKGEERDCVGSDTRCHSLLKLSFDPRFDQWEGHGPSVFSGSLSLSLTGNPNQGSSVPPSGLNDRKAMGFPMGPVAPDRRYHGSKPALRKL